ncbi:HisJ family histidinol phosphate phosphatase [Prosthecobacter fusiformis]|uniref:histidinol-phosphatase n=1 Tax=Prosthecobacter fusiformis TaxID=48464 RepID=A0A4R7RKG4_9BACT|nr:histidinol-phosphatase HisJ family protein [Prosthecobacter fusiformis]TDU64579.1 HisJ family histidinol phosphate phosphatase [Prosthecobacter fusiformis]
MSKTHPNKSKAAKKLASASKPTGKTAAKKAAVKAPSKKTAAKSASTPKTVTKKQTAKKAPVAQKAPAKKAPPVIKKVAAKNAVPVKKAVVGKKTAPVKKSAPTKKAAPQAKKAAAPPLPAAKKQVAKPASTKAAAPAKPAIAPVESAKPVVPSTSNLPTAPTPVAKSSAKTTAKQAPAVVIQEPIAPPKPPVISDEKPVANKSGALFFDSHMHTPLCKHAAGEPEEYAAQGLKSGLKGIIFTCHCPMPDGFWPSVRMSDSEFDTYVSIVDRAAQAYRGKLDVCLGLESEFFPGHEKWIENLHKRADFDYILGGLHWQSKDYLAKFETGTIENFRRSYFEHLAQSAESGLYDCLAHPDLVKNYHPDSWCFAIIKNTVTTVLDRIAKTGVAMELNSSGLNKSYSEMNPGNEMLRMMAERKIPIVIGSDAHKPSRVGEHFITALNNLSESGYEEVSYFQKRQRIDLKISDVLASIRKAIDNNS